MDIALLFDPKTGADAALVKNDIEIDPGLESAMIISLFSDRLCNVDELPVGESSRRGWWGDLVSEISGDEIGSRLWLLDRAKQTEETRLLAEEYAQESLQWLLDDGVAASLSVSAAWESPGFLGLTISLQRPSGDQVTFRFNSVWSKQNGI